MNREPLACVAAMSAKCGVDLGRLAAEQRTMALGAVRRRAWKPHGGVAP